MIDVMHRYAIYFVVDALFFGLFAAIALRRMLHRHTRGRLVIFAKMSFWSLQCLSFAYVRLGIAVHGPDAFKLTGGATELIRIAAMISLGWMTVEFARGQFDVDRRKPGRVVPRTRATDWVAPEAGKETT